VAAGDEVVVALIADRGRALTGYAYLLTGDVHDAEDLVQDALVKTFTRRRAGLQLDSAEAYLRRAILTLYLDGWRKRKRWSVRWPVAAEPSSIDGHETGVTDWPAGTTRLGLAGPVQTAHCTAGTPASLAPASTPSG